MEEGPKNLFEMKPEKMELKPNSPFYADILEKKEEYEIRAKDMHLSSRHRLDAGLKLSVLTSLFIAGALDKEHICRLEYESTKNEVLYDFAGEPKRVKDFDNAWQVISLYTEMGPKAVKAFLEQ